jgi:hypothetical protein
MDLKGGTSYLEIMSADFPRNVTIIDSKADLFNSAFQKATVADGFYIHHLTFINFNKRAGNWLACDGKPVPELSPWYIFVGAGSETIEWDYNEKTTQVKSGTYVGTADGILLSTDIINYAKEDRDVYAVSEIEYLPGQSKGYAHGEGRQIPMGACDTPDGWKGASSTSIHPGNMKKQFAMGGQKDLEVTKDGFLRATCTCSHGDLSCRDSNLIRCPFT